MAGRVGAVAIGAGVAAIAAVVVALAVAAARADAEAFRGQPSLTVMDLAVGIAFVVAPVAARGVVMERLLVAGVGVAWLAGSSFTWARSSHQAVLLVALLGFQSGHIRGLARWAVVGAAVAVALERVPQLGVVAIFAATALVILATEREVAVAAYPAGAALAVASTIWYSWWRLRQPNQASDPKVYEVSLLAVAAGFPLAVRAVAHHCRALVDRILGERPLSGLEGLEAVLARVLGDPGLTIDMCGGDAHRTGEMVDARGRRVLTAYVEGAPLAQMSTTSRAIGDAQTADAAVSVLRLAAVNQRLHEAQVQRLRELEAARTRLVAAADVERQRIAGALQTAVLAPLELAALALGDATAPTDDDETGEFLAVAAGELSGVQVDVQRLVDGVPPIALGGGRIVEAIESITRRITGSVQLSFGGDVAAAEATESALFYACSEGLANAAKHSGSATVDVELCRVGDRLVLSVRDQGRGGADPKGSGLQGLADRIAAAGGRLTVDSAPGGGTTVTVEVPA